MKLVNSIYLNFKKNTMNSENNKKSEEQPVKKENQDFPNLPAASEKVNNENDLKKQIRKSSKLNPEGKTDNTEQNSEH